MCETCLLSTEYHLKKGTIHKIRVYGPQFPNISRRKGSPDNNKGRKHAFKRHPKNPCDNFSTAARRITMLGLNFKHPNMSKLKSPKQSIFRQSVVQAFVFDASEAVVSRVIATPAVCK